MHIFIPIGLFLCMLLLYVISKHNKQKNKEKYHVPLSETIQKKYFDEYEKEQDSHQ